MPTLPRERRLALAALALYAALLALGMVRHEIWRDEAQAWLLARDSATPAAMLHAMRYEGHPALWHALLFAASRATADPRAMQVVHFAVAVAGAGVFLALAPFPLPLRALLVLGYVPLFELGVLSRNYALGLPFLWLACHAWVSRPRRWWLLAAMLALLANTNPYAWLLAGALAAALLLELRRAAAALGAARLLAAGALVAAGLALALVQMIPPADAYYPPAFEAWWAPRLWRTLGTAMAGLLPLPDWRTLTPWNSALVYRVPAEALAILAAAALAGLALLLPPRSLARRFFVVGSLVLLAFTYTRNIGWARHHAHHFVLLVACCWLAETGAEAEGAGEAARAERDARGGRRRRARLAVLAGVGVVHLAAGAWLYARDWGGTFSGAAAIGARLRTPPLRALAVYGAPDPPLTAVAAYADRPLLSLRTGAPVTYVVWRRGANVDLAPADLCLALRGAAARHPHGFALVAGRQYAPLCPGLDGTLVLATPRGLEPSEELRLWLLRPAGG